MLDQPKNSEDSSGEFTIPPFLEPGVPVIRGINWGGFLALYWKEVRRFFKVQLQTVWAPSITTLLFLVIFTVALGRGGRTVLGVPFADFIAPGLICMGMIQNAFANSSFSLLVGKIQGTIVDYLMPPLSVGELLAGLVCASITRAVLVGFAVWLAMALWPGVSVWIVHPWAVIWFGLMGSAMLALLGVLTSIWAEKFDHAAAVTHLREVDDAATSFRQVAECCIGVAVAVQAQHRHVIVEVAARLARHHPGAWLDQSQIYGDLAGEPRFSASFTRWLNLVWSEGVETTLRAYVAQR